MVYQPRNTILSTIIRSHVKIKDGDIKQRLMIFTDECMPMYT